MERMFHGAQFKRSSQYHISYHLKKMLKGLLQGEFFYIFVLFYVSPQFGNPSHLRGANKEYHKLGFYKYRSKCILNKQKQFTDGQTHHTPSTDHLRHTNGQQA